MTYQTAEQALNEWFNKRLSKLPQEVRTLARSCIPNWDELSADGRLARAREVDQQRATKSRIKFDRTLRAQERAKKDPKQIADGIIGWYDYTLDAAQWFLNCNVHPKEAAILLYQLNPHDEKDDPLTSSNDQTTPHEYKLLLCAFEDVANTSPKHRTLMEWRSIAQERGLRYHDWIDEYVHATGAQTKPDWNIWNEVVNVKTWEGTALAININPDTYQRQINQGEWEVLISSMPNEIKLKYEETLKFFGADKSKPVREVAAWAQSQGWKIPKELSARINPPSAEQLYGDTRNSIVQNDSDNSVLNCT